MEIHTASPKGSPLLITVLYVAIAIGAIAGNNISHHNYGEVQIYHIIVPPI